MLTVTAVTTVPMTLNVLGNLWLMLPVQMPTLSSLSSWHRRRSKHLRLLWHNLNNLL